MRRTQSKARRTKWIAQQSFVVLVLLICLLGRGLAATIDSPSYNWNLPAGLPKPVVPADNPMTSEKVELGRHLFYEKRLSITGNYTCASCHLQKRAFTDDRPVGIGATGEAHRRNSMSLTNIAYNSSFDDQTGNSNTCPDVWRTSCRIGNG